MAQQNIDVPAETSASAFFQTPAAERDRETRPAGQTPGVVVSTSPAPAVTVRQVDAVNASGAIQRIGFQRPEIRSNAQQNSAGWTRTTSHQRPEVRSKPEQTVWIIDRNSTTGDDKPPGPIGVPVSPSRSQTIQHAVELKKFIETPLTQLRGFAGFGDLKSSDDREFPNEVRKTGLPSASAKRAVESDIASRASRKSQPRLITLIGKTAKPLQKPSAIQQSQPKRKPPVKVADSRLEKLPLSLPTQQGIGKERFSLKIQQAEISEVMEMLAQMAKFNVFLGKNVTGTVSANLRNVTVEEAISGILRSMDFVAERDGRFLFVMTAADAEKQRKSRRKIVSKIYRPHYISSADLQSLITPILTPKPIGKIAITNAGEMGLDTDSKKAGGNMLSQGDALLVQDYSDVIKEVDAIVAEMDVPPMQVVIETMILQVTLNDDMALGVNFALLTNSRKNLLVSGNGEQLNNSSGFPGAAAGADNILPAMGAFIAPALGLKYGFIRGDISGFIDALESIGDTNLIAAPQVRVLNKQKAHLIIGDRLGFSTFTNNGTESIQNIQFLDVGTKLVIRPFIAPDGLIRLEVHPELSSGFIDKNGIPQSQTTEVTTNVMVRDGTTVVLGGLIETDIKESYSQVPFLGSLPWIGNLFRRKEESIRRRELIVLITPRIVREPADAVQGDAVLYENERRARYFRNHLSPINRSNLARFHYELAQKSFDRGELLGARRHVKDSLKHNKQHQEALRLRDQIDFALGERRRQWTSFPFFSKKTESTSNTSP
ncbi:MAG: hypothetical protein IID45_04485 [Planctomycetes bacterium]|nr:hypothetical protein [Planctomycetota bacterium]